MGMNTLPLRQLLTASSPARSASGGGLAVGLPATPAVLSTTVVSCRYAPARAGAPAEERHYWYDARPAWLAAVAAAHPIHRLVPGAAAMCPPALLQAASSPDAAPPSAAAAPAASAPPAATPASPAEGPTPNFTAKGLENEPLLTALYRGDFRKVELERESLLFGGLFGAYLNAYGRACDRYLPANKVEIMRSECAREQYQVNGYGTRVGSSICVEYRSVGTGVFADPVLYAARRELERRSAADNLRDAFKLFTRPDALGTALNMTGELKVQIRDMAELVRLNGCATPALKRFEANLMAYALSKPGIPATGLAASEAPAAAAAPRSAPSGPFQDSNYTRLLDDLVAEQSKTWAMNRFETGSMSGVAVTMRDTAGRPAKITGRYFFRGFNGRSQGAVTVEFTDGVPECLYFFDFPTTCRKASRRVSTAYAEGAYR